MSAHSKIYPLVSALRTLEMSCLEAP